MSEEVSPEVVVAEAVKAAGEALVNAAETGRQKLVEIAMGLELARVEMGLRQAVAGLPAECQQQAREQWESMKEDAADLLFAVGELVD
jgi:hypothetical protein